MVALLAASLLQPVGRAASGGFALAFGTGRDGLGAGLPEFGKLHPQSALGRAAHRATHGVSAFRALGVVELALDEVPGPDLLFHLPLPPASNRFRTKTARRLAGARSVGRDSGGGCGSQWIAYFLIERPFLRLKQRFGTR